MEQDYKQEKYNIGIIGAGASGCICAYFLAKSGFSVTLFDKGSPLRTLLPTGGGRCNLAHAEYDIKDLAKNYPRGEKFLYSIFSKFATYDTISLFEELGIKTYTQENGRIFPETNSAKDVRDAVLNSLKSKAIIEKEEVIDVKVLTNGFKIKTLKPASSKQNEYFFTHLIFATGGHSGYGLLENLGIKIIEPKPSLVGLKTLEKFNELSGTVCKSVQVDGICDDLLFTHFGVSGPLIFKISSLNAKKDLPYKISLDLAPNLNDLQERLNSSPHKEIKNILSDFLPTKVVKFILDKTDETTKAHRIDGKTRDIILERIHNFEINIIGTNKGEETVTAGGVDLKEINPKTMETKNIQRLYCIGEVLDIDGFCGGFNLQNAWSTAYVASQGIIESA